MATSRRVSSCVSTAGKAVGPWASMGIWSPLGPAFELQLDGGPITLRLIKPVGSAGASGSGLGSGLVVTGRDVGDGRGGLR